jgi:hypothetical protein
MPGGPMVPYVVRRGDHLLKIALQMGFDADTVWQDPKNADLRKSRPSMNVLCVGDVLYVPQTPQREWMPVKVGSANPYVAKVPTVQVAVKFAFEGKPLSSETCTIRELPELGTLTTTSNGTLKFEVPVALEAVTVEFSALGLDQALLIGHLDPVSELTGIYQRLSNLGFVHDDPSTVGTLDEQFLRDPLSDFQADQGLADVTGSLDDAARARLKSVYGC